MFLQKKFSQVFHIAELPRYAPLPRKRRTRLPPSVERPQVAPGTGKIGGGHVTLRWWSVVTAIRGKAGYTVFGANGRCCYYFHYLLTISQSHKQTQKSHLISCATTVGNRCGYDIEIGDPESSIRKSSGEEVQNAFTNGAPRGLGGRGYVRNPEIKQEIRSNLKTTANKPPKATNTRPTI